MIYLEIGENKNLGSAAAVDSKEMLRKFEKANEDRDYSIYVGSMDAALEAKAQSIFSHFGNIKEGGVIVDAGSGTGQMAEMAAREFHGAKVHALDISHELQERAEGGRALSSLIYGDATEQNFPDNSVDVKYFSTCGHEIETFGGTGSMKKAVQSAFRELVPGGRIIIRDFAKPSRKDPVYMQIVSKVGIDYVPEGTAGEDINYNLLSASALFLRFHEEFQGGNSFQFETEEIGGEKYIKISPEWAHEFYLRKDYTGNWRQEIREKYTYWTMEDARKTLEEAGYINVRVIPDPNDYIIKNRLEGKVALFEMKDGRLEPVSFPATHMVIIAEKPSAGSGEKEDGKAEEGKMPIADYGRIFSTIEIDENKHSVRIGGKEYLYAGKPIVGTKKEVFRLEKYPGKVLKIVRKDTHNGHNAFKTMYQTVERQSILEKMGTPHLRVLSHDPSGPPWRYLIQEAAPEGAESAAELIKKGKLGEEDIRQMAEIVNKYEKGKEWQLDTNPFGWFRIAKEDGSTQMVYVSGKVYRFDERWEFRRIGLLQWIDSRYVANGRNWCAEIPRATDFEKLRKNWHAGSGETRLWKKYLDASLQPD